MNEHDEIVLIDEEGVEHHFHLHSIVEVDGRDYALLEPCGEEGELVVLRIEGELENGNLVTLDDDEWERVAQALEEQDYLVVEADEEDEFGDGAYVVDDGDGDDDDFDDDDGEYDDEEDDEDGYDDDDEDEDEDEEDD